MVRYIALTHPTRWLQNGDRFSREVHKSQIYCGINRTKSPVVQ
ncbi:MAG: hypothetical protein WBA93_24775 [Microcoleaceae cyanobacterium]